MEVTTGVCMRVRVDVQDPVWLWAMRSSCEQQASNVVFVSRATRGVSCVGHWPTGPVGLCCVYDKTADRQWSQIYLPCHV
jgi:hypothetical protein